MTRDKYPTDADMRRGIIAASHSDSHWMFWDMQMKGTAQFAAQNFGTPPMWWARISDIAPDLFRLAVGKSEGTK